MRYRVVREIHRTVMFRDIELQDDERLKYNKQKLSRRDSSVDRASIWLTTVDSATDHFCFRARASESEMKSGEKGGGRFAER